MPPPWGPCAAKRCPVRIAWQAMSCPLPSRQGAPPWRRSSAQNLDRPWLLLLLPPPPPSTSLSMICTTFTVTIIFTFFYFFSPRCILFFWGLECSSPIPIHHCCYCRLNCC